jgi:hypothetical protein
MLFLVFFLRLLRQGGGCSQSDSTVDSKLTHGQRLNIFRHQESAETEDWWCWRIKRFRVWTQILIFGTKS